MSITHIMYIALPIYKLNARTKSTCITSGNTSTSQMAYQTIKSVLESMH